MSGIKSLVFDTETTGIPKHPNAAPESQPRIIEWGGVLVDSSGEVLEELQVLINPAVKLEPVITKITGLTDEDLVEEEGFATVAERLLRPLFAKADRLIAHNLPFDRTMMELDIERARLTAWPWPEQNLCTVQEHVPQFGRRMKLLELYAHYTGGPLEQTHRALDDVYALLEVCKHCGALQE